MNKLQELTDKLYNDGLSKGREEGARILEEARKQAEDIIADARKQAESIVAEAHRQADDYSQKVTSDLKMAGAKFIAKKNPWQTVSSYDCAFPCSRQRWGSQCR